MEEEKKKEKKAESKVLVVNELPTQQLYKGLIEGEEYSFVTKEDALTEILIAVRKLEKGLL